MVQDWHHENYPDHFKPFNSEAIGASIKTMISDPNTTVFLAENDGQPCGYALCILNVRPENAFQYAVRFLQVDHIAVLPSYQNTGAAAALVKTAEDFAKDQDCTSIQLDHWEKNDRAAAFFKKSGFNNYNFRMKKMLS